MAVAADSELRLEPSLEEARELAAEGNVVPVRAPSSTTARRPVSAFLKLRAGEPEGAPCFLLESAEQGQVGRYSFVGICARARCCAGATGCSRVEREGPPAGAEPPRRAGSLRGGRRAPGALTGPPRSRACRRSPAAPSASSATTWSAPSSRWRSRTPTRSGCPTWR